MGQSLLYHMHMYIYHIKYDRVILKQLHGSDSVFHTGHYTREQHNTNTDRKFILVCVSYDSKTNLCSMCVSEAQCVTVTESHFM